MEDANVSGRRNLLLVGLSLLAGIIFDYLFYGKHPGISYPIFILIFFCVFLWVLRKVISCHGGFESFLLIPVFLLSLTFVLYSNQVLGVINLMLIPVLIVVQTILITCRNQYKWSDLRFAEDIIEKISQAIFNIFKPLNEVVSTSKTKIGEGRAQILQKVLFGIIASIPILIIVIALLSSADKVFHNYVSEFFRLLEKIDIWRMVRHIAVVVVVTALLSGYLWTILRANAWSSPLSPAASEKILDSITVSTVLIVINIVYILFVMIQFSYLFGGDTHTLIPGYTYAEYARKGFFELLAVTVINLTILLTSVNFIKKDSKITNVIVHILLCLLIICTFVILYSSHFRLSLYEEVYGYTYARIFAHTIITLLAILFIFSLYKIWEDRISFTKVLILASLLTYVTLNYINIDALIARKNINRYFKISQVDIEYLQKLSCDAIPELIRLKGADDKVIAGAMDEYLNNKQSGLTQKTPWQSYNLSKQKAKNALSNLSK